MMMFWRGDSAESDWIARAGGEEEEEEGGFASIEAIQRGG